MNNEKKTRQKKNQTIEKFFFEIEYIVHWKTQFEKIVVIENIVVHRIFEIDRFDYDRFWIKIKSLMQNHVTSNNLICFHIRFTIMFTWYKQSKLKKNFTFLNRIDDFDSKMLFQLKTFQQKSIKNNWWLKFKNYKIKT